MFNISPSRPIFVKVSFTAYRNCIPIQIHQFWMGKQTTHVSDGHFVFIVHCIHVSCYNSFKILYSWLRFITAMIQSKSSKKTVCISGIQRSQAQASVSFPFLDYTGMLSLAVKSRNMCGMSLSREPLLVLGRGRGDFLLYIQPWQQKLKTPTIKPDTHYRSWYLCESIWETGTTWFIALGIYNKIISCKEYSDGHIPRGWPWLSHGSRFLWR